jgi:hypothetical protein
MLVETENEPTPVMTQEQCEALAERIAAVLRERKQIGDERRRQDSAYRQRNSDHARARYHQLRGGFREHAERRAREIDQVYQTIMSSNAAA